MRKTDLLYIVLDTQDLELKLLVDPESLARLRRSPLISRYAEGKPVTRQLLSVYYDTPDMALRSRGLTLRVRRIGPVHFQTVKSEDMSGSAASNRLEVEALLHDAEPDPALIADEALRRLVTKCARRSGLRPVYETDIRRTIRQLATSEGDRIELAFDTGVIRADGREEPVSELEFELKSGRTAALYRLAGSLAESYELRLGMISKAARGYALATGESGIAPVKSVTPELDPSMTVEDACCAVLRNCLAQITANEPAVVTARDPEGVHQMRVGLRRLRSAVVSFAQTGIGPWLTPLGEEARKFAARLGRARDLDVYVDEMLTPVMEGLPDHAGLHLLRAAADEQRGKGWAGARSAVASRQFTAFVLSAAAVAEERPWRQSGPTDDTQAAMADTLALPVRNLACRVLDDHQALLHEKAHSFDALTTEERHELRIELKKLRYNADFFAALYPKKVVKPYLKVLSKLQDVFGYLNDAAVAARISRKLAKRAEDGKKGPLREAVGLVTGWHSQLADQEWRQARKRWRAFEEIPPFWR